MNTTFIYALCEPGTRTIRYIGKSSNLERRLREHVLISPNYDSHLGHWVNKLLDQKLEPAMIFLKEVPETEWEDWERCYIRNAKMLGFKLVNGTEGGEGITFTPEIRKKISVALTGKIASDETRLKQSLARTGKKMSAEAGIKKGISQLGQKQANSTSKHRGVYWAAHANCWRSEFVLFGTRQHLGYYQSETDAAIVWDWVARLYCEKEFPE